MPDKEKGIRVVGEFVSAGRSHGVGRNSGQSWEQDEVSLMLGDSPRATILRTSAQVVRDLAGVKTGQLVELVGSVGDYGRLEVSGVLHVAPAAPAAKSA